MSLTSWKRPLWWSIRSITASLGLIIHLLAMAFSLEVGSVSLSPTLGIYGSVLVGLRQALSELPSRSKARGRLVRTSLNKRSVPPVGRYPTKDVARHRHPASGRERHVSGHQRLAGRRELPQETDPDTHCLLGLLVEAV